MCGSFVFNIGIGYKIAMIVQNTFLLNVFGEFNELSSQYDSKGLLVLPKFCSLVLLFQL
jgi:hypothetical protein